MRNKIIGAIDYYLFGGIEAKSGINIFFPHEDNKTFFKILFKVTVLPWLIAGLAGSSVMFIAFLKWENQQICKALEEAISPNLWIIITAAGMMATSVYIAIKPYSKISRLTNITKNLAVKIVTFSSELGSVMVGVSVTIFIYSVYTTEMNWESLITLMGVILMGVFFISLNLTAWIPATLLKSDMPSSPLSKHLEERKVLSLLIGLLILYLYFNVITTPRTPGDPINLCPTPSEESISGASLPVEGVYIFLTLPSSHVA